MHNRFDGKLFLNFFYLVCLILFSNLQDEECSINGEPKDYNFMKKLNKNFSNHEHLRSAETDKICWKNLKPTVSFFFIETDPY